MSDIVERLRRRAESLEALSDCQMDQTTMAWRVEAQFSLGKAASDNIEASTTIETLRAELAKAREATASPNEIAAAWAAWNSRHGGKLGPGPAFVEAINAAFAYRAGRSR